MAEEEKDSNKQILLRVTNDRKWWRYERTFTILGQFTTTATNKYLQSKMSTLPEL